MRRCNSWEKADSNYEARAVDVLNYYVMKVLFFLTICVVVIGCTTKKEDAGLIGDGEYSVVFVEPFDQAYEDFDLTVTGNGYEKKFKSGQVVAGELQRLSLTKFIFRDESTVTSP